MGAVEGKGERKSMETEKVKTGNGKMEEDMTKRKEERIARLEREAVYELLHYYDRSAGQKAADLIRKAAGRYVPAKDLIFWPTGLLANTLSANFSVWEDQDTVLAALRVYFDRWIDRGMPLFYMDDVLSGEALLDLYRLTGEEKYRMGAEKMARFLYGLEEQAADEAGSLPYRPAQKNGHIYVDGIGMICPFLVRFGTELGEEHAVELAVKQLTNMLRFGMSDKMQIPYHGYEYKSRLKYGIIGWGRAVGWLLLGLSGALVRLPKGHESFPFLSEEYNNLVRNVSAYQWEDGDFTWQLEAWSGPSDTSATAMIALAVLKGVEAGILGKEDAVGRALVNKAADFLEEAECGGKIQACSGECLGFGQYPQVYGAYPWSLGPGLAVLARRKGQK